VQQITSEFVHNDINNNNQCGYLNLKFKHQWRPEQKRVLENIHLYLDDKRIHLVAAPGAGKTVIGLELFGRLQLKTLVLSPTRLIRNQWLQRLSDFLSKEHDTRWCSRDLTVPGQLTASTYQGLFSLDKMISENDGVEGQYQCISQWFIEHKIKLLILDEAHHLKAAWWRVLMKFVNTATDVIVISLTATPPYDASALEWSRYQQLCGPVDEQISIPELVRSQSLCPHQDYIWMVKTDKKNLTSLERYQQNQSKFIDSLHNQKELLYLLQSHDWLNPYLDLEVKDVLYHLDECFALLGLLSTHDCVIPQKLLAVLDIDLGDIPQISVFGWQALLQGFIDGDHYPQAEVIESFRETLITLLRNKHFLKKRRVSLDNSQRKLDAFNKTQERIKACCDIAVVEYKNRRNWLRLVILSDFIRDEKFKLALNGLEATTGAYPIFHYFIHHLPDELRLKTVLLTGRLIIIPKKLISAVADALPAAEVLQTQEYSEHQGFVRISNGSDKLSMALTDLHKKGDVLIIIGTRALLGEGWDAPHVNALIMATQTGAYVSSNQIRGRAIRIDNDDDLKTASIWHIVAVANNAVYNQYIFQDLDKRFKTFAGIHAHKLLIESGVQRLQLDQQMDPDRSIIAQSNEVMSKRLEDDIFNLQARWQNALQQAEEFKMQSGLQLNMTNAKSNNNLSRYIARIDDKLSHKMRIINYVSVASFAVTPVLLTVMHWQPFAAITAALAAIYSAVRHRHHLRAKISAEPRYYTQKFSLIVLATLKSLKLLQTSHPIQTENLNISEVKTGYYRISLLHYSNKDNEIFLDALNQLLEPIKMPRYLISITKAPDIKDLFPIPHVFAINKKRAGIFLKHWLEYLPEFKSSQLISTSSTRGRTLLLKTKAAMYAHKQTEELRIIDRWQ
jgi:superfamily II DNA or RNA helicase